jgi:hypothetical protein
MRTKLTLVPSRWLALPDPYGLEGARRSGEQGKAEGETLKAKTDYPLPHTGKGSVRENVKP